MYDNPTRQLTDEMYQILFGKTTLGLLIHFRLSPLMLQDEQDGDLRDCMGEEALRVLSDIEHACAETINQIPSRKQTMDKLMEIVRFHATEIGNVAKANCAGAGIDLLTGQRLVEYKQEER